MWSQLQIKLPWCINTIQMLGLADHSIEIIDCYNACRLNWHQEWSFEIVVITFIVWQLLSLCGIPTNGMTSCKPKFLNNVKGKKNRCIYHAMIYNPALFILCIKPLCLLQIYDVTWAQWRINITVPRLCVQQLLPVNSKIQNIRPLHYWTFARWM